MFPARFFSIKRITERFRKASITCVPLPGIPRLNHHPLPQTIITRIKRAKLFVFLRHHRHEIFDDAFQEELASLYVSSLRGQPPIAPAQLALATIVQAYTGVSDDEVIEAMLMDRDGNWSSIAWIQSRLPLAREHW